MYRLLDLHSLWGHSGDAAAAQQCQIHALDTCSGLPYTDRLLGFLVVLLIVGIAFVYEGAMHSIEHRCPAELRPTLMRVLSEMAQLGFVSTLVHIPSKTNWFVGLSGRLFSDCNHLLHLVHDIHFLVFWAMLAFLVYNLLLLCGSIVWGQQWARYEKLAMVEIDPAQLRRYQESGRCVHWLRLLVLNFCGIDYRLARERFIDDVTDHQRNKDIWNITAIPTTFPFYEYLRLQQSMFHVALVEITATSWLCLPVALSVMYYLSFTSLHTQVLLCTGWQCVMAGLSLILQLYIAAVYRSLAPQLEQDAYRLVTEQREANEEHTHCHPQRCLVTLTVRPAPPPLSSYGSASSHSMSPSHSRNNSFVGGSMLINSVDAVVTRVQGLQRFRCSSRYSRSQRESLSPWHSRESLANKLAPRALPGRIPGPPRCPVATGNYERLPVLLRSLDVIPENEIALLMQGRESFLRSSVQLILLFTGVNTAIFIKMSAPYLWAWCGEAPGLNTAIFFLHVFVLLLQAVALCQAMRVHTLLYSTGPYKNYTTISLVLHKLKLRQLLMHLRRTFLGAAHTPWTGDVAAELFAVLDTLQCGQISAAVMQECMTLCSTTHHLDIKSDDVWVIMRHMDKDGDGFISQAEFCRECRRIFQN